MSRFGSIGGRLPERSLEGPTSRQEPERDVDPDRHYEQRVERDGPWRYACPDCESVSLSKRTREGGYRCGECGWTGAAEERVDRRLVTDGGEDVDHEQYAAEHIERGLRAPADDYAFHARLARDALPIGHDARETLADALGGYDQGYIAPTEIATFLRLAYGQLSPESADQGAGDGATGDENDVERLREAFADAPRLEEPTAQDRWLAKFRYPPVVVPDEGPIPDPRHTFVGTTIFGVPEWVIEAIVYRFEAAGEPVVFERVQEKILEYVEVRTEFITTDTNEPVIDVVTRRVYGEEFGEEFQNNDE